MADRIALISGGSRGIGAAVCAKLLAGGWTLSVGLRPGSELPAHLRDASRVRNNFV